MDGLPDVPGWLLSVPYVFYLFLPLFGKSAGRSLSS